MALGRFQRTLTDANGNVVSGATVTVRVQETNALAALFADRAGSEPLGNPITTGANGEIAFHALGDAYKITAVKDSFSVEWSWVGVGTAQEYDIGDFLVIPAGDGQVLANLSGETADAEGESVSDVLDYVFGSAQGSLLYRGASAWARLAPGTAGQILRSGGASANPSWIDASVWRLAQSASDQTRTSSTTWVDVTGLGFPVEASKSYVFRTSLFLTCGAGGMQLGMNGPSSPSVLRCGRSAAGVVATSYDSSFETYPSAYTTQLSAYGLFVNGSNEGTLALRFRQNSSNAAATTIFARSFIEWREIS